MRHSRTHIRLALAVLLAVLGIASRAQEPVLSPYATISYAGQLATLRSQSRRCLSGALCTLAGQYTIPLSFEDAPIAFRGDYDDITSPTYRPKDDSDHLLVPKGGPMVVSFANPSAQMKPADVAALLKLVIKGSADTGFPGVYGIRQSDHVWHVIPIAARDAIGDTKQVTPLMDSKISLPYQPGRTNKDVFSEMFAQIKKATGREIFIGTPLGQDYLGANNSESAEISARELLERSFTLFGGHRLWLLQCTPRSGPCALSIF